LGSTSARDALSQCSSKAPFWNQNQLLPPLLSAAAVAVKPAVVAVKPAVVTATSQWGSCRRSCRPKRWKDANRLLCAAHYQRH
jgi:hypothetical protein